MAEPKTISHPRIRIDHPRRPEPSRALLWVRVDWLKGEPIAEAPMTEDDLYTLAEESLKVASILRRQRLEGRN